MGKKICFLALYILLSVGCMSQFAFPVVGARTGAMGGVSVALTDFWSALDNVAALHDVGGPAVGVALKQTFMMDRLCYKTLAFSLPVSEVGAVAMRYTHFGKAIYNFLSTPIIDFVKRTALVPLAAQILDEVFATI